MAALSMAAAFLLANAVASSVSPTTVVTFAKLESGLNPNAIHDNSSRRSYAAETPEEASAIAKDLIAKGHSVDLGIMQINNANLSRVGLQISTAFDPKESMRAGAILLKEAYFETCHGKTPTTDAPDPEIAAALSCAASVYNTGTPDRGIKNGYVGRIERVAAKVVPSVQELLLNFPSAALAPVAVDARPSEATPTSAPEAPKNPPAPGGWDVFAKSGGPQFVFVNNK